MAPSAKGLTAVMARRREPPDALDYFPTPPWATRALFRHVLPALGIEAIDAMAAALDGLAGLFAVTVRVLFPSGANFYSRRGAQLDGTDGIVSD